MKIHHRMKTVRRAHDLTLKELAVRTTFSVSSLSDIERGKTTPSLGTLEALSAAFGMTVIDFMTGVDCADKLEGQA